MLKNIRQLLPEGRPPHGFGYGKKAAKEAAYAAQQKRRREKRMVIAAGAASAAAFMTWTLWQNTALMLREISVTDDSIPEAFPVSASLRFPIFTTPCTGKKMKNWSGW